MIEKVRIKGYRKFVDETIFVNPKLNIFVGENQAGKSTILEAMSLALTGRIDGRPAAEHLNPYWFNAGVVKEFYRKKGEGEELELPRIEIEVFLEDREEYAKNLLGANNSDSPVSSVPGIRFIVAPDPEFSDEIREYLKGDSKIIPVEYYQIIWETFALIPLYRRPKEISIAIVNHTTVRTGNGVDQHVRQILREYLKPLERAQVALAYRKVKEALTDAHLSSVNKKLEEIDGPFDGGQLSIAMDQSAKGAWDAGVVPLLDDIPFSLAGQGQQASAKIALSVSDEMGSANAVLIEEPENHLSHTSLNILLSRIGELAENNCQLFITTHSSFVLNRLGLNSLCLVSSGTTSRFSDLSSATERYFQRLSGFDTLRMVLADKVVLVEGPSDEILFEAFYEAKYHRLPIQDGIDVISMRGLSLKTNLEFANVLKKKCAVLTDNDGKTHAQIIEDLGQLVDGDMRSVFIGSESEGLSLEDQVLSANDPQTIRTALNTNSKNILEWMKNNKTEAALRLATFDGDLNAPQYFLDAMEFIHE